MKILDILWGRGGGTDARGYADVYNVERAVRRLAVRGPQRGDRRRVRLEARGVLRERVPAQVQRRLEAAAARGAHHRLRLVDEPHVLAQVGRVAVAAPALRAPHAPAPAGRAAARAAPAARCQQHHDRTAPPPSRRPPPYRPTALLPQRTNPIPSP
ncbi:unnamed protein product, partial [Brenthis ino]